MPLVSKCRIHIFLVRVYATNFKILNNWTESFDISYCVYVVVSDIPK